MANRIAFPCRIISHTIYPSYILHFLRFLQILDKPKICSHCIIQSISTFLQTFHALASLADGKGMKKTKDFAVTSLTVSALKPAELLAPVEVDRQSTQSPCLARKEALLHLPNAPLQKETFYYRQ